MPEKKPQPEGGARKRRRDKAATDGLHATFTLRIADMPEIQADLRREMARILRDVADDEEARVADRLRAIATAFEIGQSEDLP